MKKKIIFCMQTMVLGGVEKELITILNRFDKSNYDISVLVFYIQDQAVMDQLPNWVHVINFNLDKDYYCGNNPMIVKKRIEAGKLLDAFIICLKWLFKIGMVQTNMNFSGIPTLDQEYDIAVCYHIFSPIMFKYVAQKIKANKKIAWIHNEIETTGYRIDKLKKYVCAYDEIVSVSKRVNDEFMECCPEFRDRAFVAYNILDEDEIKAKAALSINDPTFAEDQTFKLLSIGRFTDQKGIDLAIEACKKLKENSMGIHWYLIGWGPEEEKYRNLIKKYELEKEFVILGRKDNPYPYIKMCDLYVQPSRHEAFSLTLKEAKILCKPILVTDFAGASEQITNGVNGRIIPVNDVEALSNGVAELVQNDHTREHYVANLLSENRNDSAWKTILSHF